MQSQNIADLRNSSEVTSVQRGVSSDWIVITEPADGPVPNPAVLFTEHGDRYEVVSIEQRKDSDYVHIEEA